MKENIEDVSQNSSKFTIYPRVKAKTITALFI